MKKQKHKISSIIISVIFVIWFIGSVALMIFCGKTGRGGLAPALIGQYFLVFGLIIVIGTIKNKEFNPITLIFPSAGALCIIVTLINYFGSENIMTFIDENMPYILMALFLVVGIVLVAVALSRYFGRKKRCSYSVTAKCTELRERADNGHMMACPVYEIWYNGEVIKLCDDVYSNNIDVKVGDEKEIMINPDKPTEYFSAAEMTASAIIIGGIGFAIILVMIFAFFMTEV